MLYCIKKFKRKGKNAEQPATSMETNTRPQSYCKASWDISRMGMAFTNHRGHYQI
mgnify:CR=1 FL=1